MPAQRSLDPALSRRQLLRIGGLGCLGLSIADVLRAEATSRPDRPAASIRSCILIFYYGGPSHLDTWDMKPGAPAEVRGEFQSIATSVPGLRISEHLPHSARRGPARDHSQHAPPDDQPQRRGVRDTQRATSRAG